MLPPGYMKKRASSFAHGLEDLKKETTNMPRVIKSVSQEPQPPAEPTWEIMLPTHRPYQSRKGNAWMIQQFSREDASILHELDLGQHTLFIMYDGSIDLLANDEQTPSLAENGIRLDGDETYRLFISLHEQFKQKGAAACTWLNSM